MSQARSVRTLPDLEVEIKASQMIDPSKMRTRNGTQDLLEHKRLKESQMLLQGENMRCMPSNVTWPSQIAISKFSQQRSGLGSLHSPKDSSSKGSTPKNAKGSSPKNAKGKSPKTQTVKNVESSSVKSTSPKSSKTSTPKKTQGPTQKKKKGTSPKNAKNPTPKATGKSPKGGKDSSPGSQKPKAHAKMSKIVRESELCCDQMRAVIKEHQEKKKRDEESAQMILAEGQEEQESSAQDQPVQDELQMNNGGIPQKLSKMQKRRVDMMKSAEWMREIGKKRKSPRKANGAGCREDESDSDEGDGDAMNDFFLPAYHHMLDALKKLKFDANRFMLDTTNQCEDGIQKALVENRLGLSKFTLKDKKAIDKLAAQLRKENPDYVLEEETSKQAKRGKQ
eukprot:702854-Hanusia_phi.AAC.2